MGAVLPLGALRAFAEAGRLGTLAAAADRLGVTPGAISQQIRQLEDRIGQPLLLRSRQGVTLTPAGALMHPVLVASFDRIEAALQAVQQLGQQQSITISTVPSFAAAWLVPRLGDFSARHADVEVRVEASAGLVDLHGRRVDLAIRHGLGDYPGLYSERLMAPVLIPVASPALLQGRRQIGQPTDCLHYPLLHDSERADWRLWLQAHGAVPSAEAQRGPALEDDLLLLRAAAAGQGIALVDERHAREYLDEGKLVVVLDLPWPARFAYYLVCAPQALERPAVANFCAWIRQQAAQLMR